MWTLLVTLFFILNNVSTNNLRKNPDLWTFNTDVNANITAKIQEEAVIIALQKLKTVDDELSKEHVLFGFDIFNFVPQSFRVSVDYPRKKLFLNLTSTSNSYSIDLNLGKIRRIESLFLRMSDEDDTVFLVLNCDENASVVAPMNLIQFFRSVSSSKFKILFNRHYILNVFTEEDDMEVKLQEGCNVRELLPDGRKQFDLQLNKLAQSLTKYTPHLITLLADSNGQSEIATEVFIKSFLSKNVFHQSSNAYRLVHLLQSLMKRFPEVFQSELQELLTKIFWTEGKEYSFVRKGKMNYYDDIDIKTNLVYVLFADSPKTFIDSMRNLTDIGERFRSIFANQTVSINKVMSNETRLRDTLLEIVFKQPLDEDQLQLLNPNHIIFSMFGHYYLKDLNVHPNIINNIQKRIIFNSDKNDYVTIGKFIRYVFLKDSGLLQAKYFLESDLVIGMRVVYVLSSGKVNEKRDIYWMVRNLITKKDVELPKALEYSEHIIINTLSKCYLNPEYSRKLFMLTLENLFVYNNPNIGSFLDKEHGAFIYNLFRDLILEDIRKEKSILKGVFLEASSHIHEMIGHMIQAVVANIDKVKEVRQLAVNFVNDTMSYARLKGSDIVKTEEDYVTIFKKIVGKASAVSNKQKIINFKMMLVGIKYNDKKSVAVTINNILSRIFLKLTNDKTQKLIDLYEKYHASTDILFKKIDEVLSDENTHENQHLDEIIKQDIREGVKFYNASILQPTTIFHLSTNEEAQISKERMAKIKELNVLEEWYREEVDYSLKSSKSSNTTKNVTEPTPKKKT